MNLLTFAHRGEAQHFLKTDNFQSIEFSFNGLYKNKNNYLLITGEGLQAAQEKTTTILSRPNLNIDKIINMGIAGALDENLKLDSICSIKKIKKENSDETFMTSDENAETDCISALDRVHDVDYRNELVKKAQIVDRELWAIAKVCHSFHLPILSIKLISDYAGDQTDTERIIKKAKEYSKKLYDFYINYS